MNTIETNELTKSYAHKLVVDHVSMHIPEGSIYGFVGENGAGKTTIMRLVSGLAIPTSGSYSLYNIDHKDKAIYEVRRKLSAIVEIPSLIQSMTAEDNLHYACLYLGIKDESVISNVLKQVGLNNTGKKKVKNFSLGMRQRLGIALSLLGNPTCILLDEPMNGLDPEGIASLRDLIIELNQKHGITFLISSHILSELEKVATHYGFISHGKLIKEISSFDLKNDCLPSIEVKVDKVDEALEIFKKKYKKYELLSSGYIRLYDDVKITSVIEALEKNDLEIIGIYKKEENVEDYYLNLIKGVNK